VVRCRTGADAQGAFGAGVPQGEHIGQHERLTTITGDGRQCAYVVPRLLSEAARDVACDGTVRTYVQGPGTLSARSDPSALDLLYPGLNVGVSAMASSCAEQGCLF